MLSEKTEKNRALEAAMHRLYAEKLEKIIQTASTWTCVVDLSKYVTDEKKRERLKKRLLDLHVCATLLPVHEDPETLIPCKL